MRSQWVTLTNVHLNLSEKEQKIVEIAGISWGGQPGEYPTVLIGSLFYQGHKIVQDFKKGIFDKATVETLLNQQDSLSEKTGNPCLVDIIGETPEALINFIDFIGDWFRGSSYLQLPRIQLRRR